MLNRNKKEGHALIFYFPNTDAMLKSKKILSLLQSDVVSGGINMDFLTAFDTLCTFYEGWEADNEFLCILYWKHCTTSEREAVSSGSLTSHVLLKKMLKFSPKKISSPNIAEEEKGNQKIRLKSENLPNNIP